MKRLLIVSPHFPPVNAPDLHRVRTALPYLRAHGWHATVLAVHPDDVAAPRDESLSTRLPADVRVERCRAWPLHLTRRIGLRTLGWRAWRALDRAGARLIGEEKPDLVLFTTTQFLTVTLGPRWLRRFGVPFVVDLQDPWVTNYYSRPGAPPPPGGWKYRIARALAGRLEPAAFRPAAGFVSVSPAYLEELNTRYPWFSAKPQITIPFGVDEPEFATAIARAAPVFTREPDRLHLVSVGAIGPIMTFALRALFTQLQALRRESPELATRLRVHFFGTSYAPKDQAHPSVQPIAREYGLDDIVSESTARIPWDAAQATMRAADGLIVLTSDDPAYTPSKLAGCFLAHRPVLVVAGPTTAAAHANADLGLGRLLDPSAPPNGTLPKFIHDLTDRESHWQQRRRPAFFETYCTAAARTRELSHFLDRLIPSAPGHE